MTPQGNQSAFVRKRMMLAMLGLVVFPLLLLQAAPPTWWSQRGATIATPPDDFAAVNQGQLKHFTRKAVDEMNARLPDGSGTDLNALVQTWATQYQTGGYTPANPNPADFHAITIGQLKWIAQKIQNHLVAVQHITTMPPWLQGPATTDTQVANLGQLKAVFAFDLTAPEGQLPLWWQRLYFNGQTGIDPEDDPDGDGVSNLEEYLAKTNPTSNDSDGDGMLDGYEIANGLNPLFDDTLFDRDNDFIPNREDARPNDIATGRLSVSISTPFNGGTYP